MKKMTEVITDIIHTATQAALTDDEQVKRQGLADIYDAIASVMRLDHRASQSPNPPIIPGCPSLMPTHLPGGIGGTEPAPEKLAEFCQSEMQREEARRLRKIVWKCYQTKVDLCVMGKTRQNGKVYEVRISKRGDSKVQDTYGQCKVNGKTVLTCSFTGSAWMLKRILTKGMQDIVNHKAKRNRDKRRREAKRVAANKALIEKELA